MYILPFLEIESSGTVKFKPSIKRSEFDWSDEYALSNDSESPDEGTAKKEPSMPPINRAQTIEQLEVEESKTPGRESNSSMDSIQDEDDNAEPPIMVVDHGDTNPEPVKPDTAKHDRYARRKSHLEIMADKIIRISSFDELLNIMRENKISWMDFFYQMDSAHTGRVSSYEVYIHLYRDMKISKKLSTRIVKDIDFNLDGFATLEEWMKYEVKLPEDIQKNAVYKWSDFKAKLFQTLVDNNLKWSTIFSQSKQFSDAAYVPTHFILHNMVDTLHMPRTNVKELLQKIDVDQDGIITEKEWNCFFKEADVGNQAVKPFLFDEQEKMALAAAKVANRQRLNEDMQEFPNLANLGIVDQLWNRNENPNEVASPDAGIGMNIPAGDFTLYIESDLTTLDSMFMPLFKDADAIQRLERIGTATLERFPTGMSPRRGETLKASPSAKNGPMDAFGYTESVLVGADSVPDRQMKPVNAEPEVVDKFVNGGRSNKKMGDLSPVNRHDDLDDFEKFSADFGAAANGGNLEGSFNLEGFDGKSAGRERSFSASSSEEEIEQEQSCSSHSNKVITIAGGLSNLVPRGHLESMRDAVSMLKFPSEEVSVTQIVSMLQRVAPQVPRNILASVAKSVDSRLSGFILKKDWESLSERIGNLPSHQEVHCSQPQTLPERSPTNTLSHGRTMSIEPLRSACQAPALEENLLQLLLNRLDAELFGEPEESLKMRLEVILKAWLKDLPLAIAQVSDYHHQSFHKGVHNTITNKDDTISKQVHVTGQPIRGLKTAIRNKKSLLSQSPQDLSASGTIIDSKAGLSLQRLYSIRSLVRDFFMNMDYTVQTLAPSRLVSSLAATALRRCQLAPGDGV